MCEVLVSEQVWTETCIQIPEDSSHVEIGIFARNESGQRGHHNDNIKCLPCIPEVSQQPYRQIMHQPRATIYHCRILMCIKASTILFNTQLATECKAGNLTNLYDLAFHRIGMHWVIAVAMDW